MEYSHFRDYYMTLLQSFAQKGWCPRQVHYLMDTFDLQVLSYLSSLDRPRFRSISHETCQDSTHCSAYNVDRETYEPAHTGECSTTPGSCTLVGVDTGNLIDTIHKGKAPLISINLEDDDNISLQITPRNPETQYIALSHVWSDGLGNPRGNALPSCQLKQLKRQMAKIDLLQHAPPALIWIDTLCVPVAPEHSCYRKQEIKRMASIYAGATAILVVDSELQQINSSAIHHTEILARIICSVWMQRCWTLEEGIVSGLCFFQFKNASIDPPVFLIGSARTTVADHQRHIYDMLRSYLWDRLQYGRSGGTGCVYYGKESLQKQRSYGLPMGRIRPFVSSIFVVQEYCFLGSNMGGAPSNIAFGLVRTWNELAHRSTSRPEDIYAILASVLGFSPERIMNLPTNAERLQTLIFSLPYLPVSLFYNTGPRHEQAEMHNNRWVPEEIGNYMLKGSGIMRFTDEALYLNSWGRPDIYLVTGVLSDEVSFHISTQFEAVYQVRLFHQNSSGNDALRSRYKFVCLLFQRPLSAETQHTCGALFRIHKMETNGNCPTKSHSNLDLIFDCPVDIYRAHSTICELDVKDTAKIEHSTKVSVRYGEQQSVSQLLT